MIKTPYSHQNVAQNPQKLQTVAQNSQKPTTVFDQQKLTTTNNKTSNNNSRVIWDCGSALYDSFELDSLKKQLDSAIITNSSRSLSMPRLPSDDHRRSIPPPPQQPPLKKPVSSPPSKLSRSFQKLLRSVFRTTPRPNNSKPNSSSGSNSPDPWFFDPPTTTTVNYQDKKEHSKSKNVNNNGGKFYVVYDKPNGLFTIPEVPEVNFSPEIGSLVRKTMSDRFTAKTVGIYCS